VRRPSSPESRTRDGGNGLLTKEFPGGVLFLTGSNSATGVKSRPIRWLFCDEIDEYPGDVDGQGDPIALAGKRFKTEMLTRGEWRPTATANGETV
jgi:phage terminase large subunit GpA-like protein